MVDKGVSAVVFNPEEEKFLVLKRSDENEYYTGVWQFPGGGLKDGEEPRKGVIRELKEETGLDGQILKSGSYRWESKHGGQEMKTYAFLVKVDETEVDTSWEHDDCRWVDLCELEDMDTFEFIHRDLEAVGVEDG